MPLLEQLTADYKEAMKNREEVRKLTLNYVLAQIKNKKIEVQHELTDDEIIALIKKEIKSLNEAISFLEKAENKADDLIEEQQKKSLLEAYLPQMLSFEQTQNLIFSLIKELGITDLKTQRWVLMKALMATYKSKLDTEIVNEIINERISSENYCR